MARKRRFGLSLGGRFFLLTALVVALAVGAAVVVTALLGERTASAAVRGGLARSVSVQQSFQFQRLDQLRLIAELFVGDRYLTGYLIEGNAEEVLNLLEERQNDLGFDFAILLDHEGRVVTRTDDPNASGDDLSRDALVETALEQFEGRGVWAERGHLFYAVASPLTAAQVLEGFLICGFVIDDLAALEVRRISDTHVAFLSGDSSRPQVVGSTLDAALKDQLLKALQERGDVLVQVFEHGQVAEQLELDLGGTPWLASVRPLLDAAGKPVGATVSLASIAEQLAPYRQIQSTLLGVGGAAILLAFLVSFAISRRVMRPVRKLAAMAQAASEGDYNQKIEVTRSDEVGQLAGAFDVLLSELREKRDMESYVTELARTFPESGGRPAGRTESRRLSLLVFELRRYAHSRAGLDADDTIDRLAQDLRRIQSAVSSRKGHIEAMLGHRVLVTFEGMGAAQAALAAAGEAMAGLTKKQSAFDEGDPPTAALASGETITGPVVWGEQPGSAVLGLPVQQLESLLREATPGDIVLAPQLYKELSETLTSRGIEVSQQRGLLSTQPVFLLTAAAACRAGDSRLPADDLPTQLTAVSAEPRDTFSGVAPGSLLGDRFEILSALGAGGMGVVYKVRDRELDDLVALKMLRRDVWGDASQLERLKSEIKLARKITHPNVLRTFDFGEIDGIHFITMEYVRGVTLRTLLDQAGRLPFSAALRLARQLCRALSVAHGVGVLHRDVKPENLIVEPTGNAKLMDFGIARPMKRSAPGQTQPGAVVGTPHYLSPEQLEGNEPDQRGDIYAVGVVLYELFTGRLPFTGDTPMKIVLKHIQEQPMPPRKIWLEMPELLETIILRCLEKKPGNRYQSIDALLGELEKLRA